MKKRKTEKEIKEYGKTDIDRKVRNSGREKGAHIRRQQKGDQKRGSKTENTQLLPQQPPLHMRLFFYIRYMLN